MATKINGTPQEGMPTPAEMVAKREADVANVKEQALAHLEHLTMAAAGRFHQDKPDAWQPEKPTNPLEGSAPAPAMGTVSGRLGSESPVGPAYDANGMASPAMGKPMLGKGN